MTIHLIHSKTHFKPRPETGFFLDHVEAIMAVYGFFSTSKYTPENAVIYISFRHQTHPTTTILTPLSKELSVGSINSKRQRPD